jgi:RNA polymerase sigma-70 factor (ECF subfamily)
MSDQTTTRLIQAHLDRLHAGDAGARDGLIGVACERLRRLTRRMLGDFPGVRRWEETDDVLSEAVLRLCRALEDVCPATAREFLGLAALQVRRELCDLARRFRGPEGFAAHHASGAAGGEPGGPAAAPPNATHELHRLAAWAEFHRLVKALPPEEREVFDLLWYQGLTQPEAAGVLGVALVTVKRRWQSARRRLFDLLGGDLPF